VRPLRERLRLGLLEPIGMKALFKKTGSPSTGIPLRPISGNLSTVRVWSAIFHDNDYCIIGLQGRS